MADYKFLGPTTAAGIKKLTTGENIPNAPGNLEWREYRDYVANGGETDPWRTQAELDTEEALAQRVADIIQEREADGSSKYTPVQIRTYIDNQIDNAATAADKLEAIKGILKKLAIYILK